MKLELPLALVLIAAGCWLWSQHHDARIPLFGERPDAVDSDAVENDEDQLSNQLASQPAIQDAAIQNGNNDHERKDDTASNLAGQGGSAWFADPDARQLVVDAAESLTDSMPFTSRVRFETRMFENEFNASGSYAHQGQGTRKSKLELFSGATSNVSRLTQICDGRFCYRIFATGKTTPTAAESEPGSSDSGAERAGSIKQIEVVDLDRLHKAANAGRLPPSRSAGSPGGWMATGGLSSLLEHLSRSFKFAPAYHSRLGDVETLVVRGVWDETMLRTSLAGQIESELLVPEINWMNLPDQVPHAVELTFGADDFFHLFPYRIAFLRFDPSQRDSRQGVPDQPMTTIAMLELYDVTRLNSMDDSVFQIDLADVQANDMTAKYVAQMNQRQEVSAGNQPVANQAAGNRAESNQPAGQRDSLFAPASFASPDNSIGSDGSGDR